MYDINTIKLGDFGLSRLLEEAASYYVASNGKLENGERLNKPDLCPHPLFSLLEHCWKYDPTERPTAAEVDTRIELLIEQMESMEQRKWSLK